MYSKHIENIRKLSEKMTAIQAKAMQEGRALTAKEAGWVAECEDAIDAERKHLPANSPLTMQGFGGSRGLPSSSGPFPSLGEQFQAIAKAGIPGGQVDPRLYNAATGLSETVPSDGGFLVQTDFSNEILQASFEVGKLAKLCRRIPISGNSNGIKIPGLDETSRAAGSRHGGVLSYWKDEASQLTASKPKFRQIELSLKKNVSLIYTTDELLQDSTALEAYIRKVAADEIAFQTDDAIVNGTGAGMPLGILNGGALVTISKETGQAADTVILENIVKMWSRMLGSSRSNAVWLINQNVEPQLYTMSLSVGTGGAPVFLPGGGASAAPYMTLFGRPVIPCEQCASLGDAGDIILADFSNGYIMAEKGGIQAAMSIHVKFDYDESVFRFVIRMDGQPVLAAPVTPYKGGSSYTQSHFVTLEAR